MFSGYFEAFRDPITSPLVDAIKNGHTESAIRLIEEGANLSETIKYRTPAHEAAARGNIEVLDRIYEHGGPINPVLFRKGGYVYKHGRRFYPDIPTDTPAEIAVKHGHVEVVKWFEQHGIDLCELDKELGSRKYNDKTSLMHKAAEGGSLPMIKYLAKKDFELSRGDSWGLVQYICPTNINLLMRLYC